nr:hypothetical protein [Tanacetum cinerariifolium]GFA52579.1 hypothetical protein [Tanacetum cinerariifolium]
MISSPDHSTSNNEDAFSFNIPDYISTIPDFLLLPQKKHILMFQSVKFLRNSPASSGKTYSKELPIPPPVILPPSLVLSQSPISDSQDFFPSEEISPKDT